MMSPAEPLLLPVRCRVVKRGETDDPEIVVLGQLRRNNSVALYERRQEGKPVSFDVFKIRRSSFSDGSQVESFATALDYAAGKSAWHLATRIEAVAKFDEITKSNEHHRN